MTSGNSDTLLCGTFRSTNLRDGPKQAYTVMDGIGMLTISQESSIFFDPIEKIEGWNISLHQTTPIDLILKSGTGDISLHTRTVNLTSLDIDAGAGDVIVDLTEWKGNHLPVSISSGLGSLSVILPQKTSIAAETDNGLGSRTISGLEGGDGHYYHTETTPGSPVISLSIKQGLGDLTLKTGI
ncbi:MAG: hypothetical protein CVV33_06895 [Methanomicrobiales archaeon HGW-Methanomicrobiales-4]|nr:MAG: hypothetical protein CVV33_06895 [Methanomicrobiales archaeon HGW-Methanomicrobiales-4]